MHVRPRVRRSALVLTALVLLVAGCGDGSDDGREVVDDVDDVGQEGPTGEWTSQELTLDRGPDTRLLSAVDGDESVLLTASDEGVVSSARAVGAGEFETGPALATGFEYLQLGGLARHDGTWVAVGPGGTMPVPTRPDDWTLSYEMHVLTSPDGLTWTEVDATGLDTPADITDVVATDAGLVALGTLRLGEDPGNGGFRPAAWHSADGRAWEQVDLAETEGGVADVVATANGLLAIGSTDAGTQAWTGTGAADGWTATTLEGVPDGVRLTDVERLGDRLVASAPPTEDDGMGGPPVIVVSDDDGRTWRPTEAPPTDDLGEPWVPLTAGAGRVTTVLPGPFPGDDPKLCYVDAALCQGEAKETMFTSTDGDAWVRNDTSGVALEEYGDLDQVLATDDRLSILSTGESGVVIWTWPGDAPLPVAPEPVPPEEADVVFLTDGEEPEVGVTYAQALYLHCGTDTQFFGDQQWRRTDDGPEPDRQVYGFFTLTDADHLEYTDADGEVIATYERDPGEVEYCM